MKKIIITFIAIFATSFPAIADNIELNEIRNAFYQITVDSKNAPILLEKLYAHSKPDAMIIAYTAATEAIMAKLAWNPYSKLNYLFKSRKTFLSAIELNKTNAEIRFLRFAVQHHLPKYLGLSKDMLRDKRVMMKGMDDGDRMHMTDEIADYIIRFLIASNKCTEEEVNAIKGLLMHQM